MEHANNIRKSAKYILEKLGKIQEATTALITGSGLGGITDALSGAKAVPYADIPHFPISTVVGHAGRLLAGEMGGRPVLVLDGRVHLYEGFTPAQTAWGVRVLHELGVKTLIVTNAAGALNPAFDAGSPMLVTDHINLTGQNPLTGPNNDAWGERFPDMSRVYDRKLRDLAMAKALELGIRLEQGVYVQIPGPSLETPAETRMLRRLGGDAVGMSTVMEIIAARHLSMRVLAVSCLTNKNLPDCMAPISHQQVLAQAGRASTAMARIIEAVLKEMD